MKPRSALWPRTATGTTWWPSASARLDRGDDRLAVGDEVGLAEEVEHPQPDLFGLSGSAMASSYGLGWPPASPSLCKG